MVAVHGSASDTGRRRRTLLWWAVLSGSVSSLVVLSAALDGASRLGAPQYWTWVLTGLQVLALQAAGQRRRWAWPLGASVQPVWITYAILTGQIGFIPGCVVSSVVQFRNALSSLPGRTQESPPAERTHTCTP